MLTIWNRSALRRIRWHNSCKVPRFCVGVEFVAARIARCVDMAGDGDVGLNRADNAALALYLI